VNGVFFFSAYDSVNGSALWKSDGTRSGTKVVKKFVAETVGAPSSEKGGGTPPTPRGLLNVGGTLYFCAYEITSGWELWKSNGTSAGTIMVKDIYPGSSDGVSEYCYLASIGSTVFFDGTDTSEKGPALWKTDGTAVNTVIVKDVQPVPESNGGRPEHLFVMNNTLYFIGNDAVHGYQWWKSDGTEGGTTMVTDLAIGVFISSSNENPVILGDYFYFQGNDGINGYELWRSDGTGAGTTLVKNINETPYVPNDSGDSYPSYLTLVNGTIFFRADDDIHGRELWKSDGTPGNTTLVKDIHPGTGLSSEPYNLTDVSGTLYFTADDGTNGSELWKSDGTLDGTAMVKDINPGSGSSWPSYFIAFHGEVYFSAENVTNGTELWKTNGTVGNATLVKDIIPGSNSSWPVDFLVMNDTLFFAATYNSSAPEGTGDALFRYGELLNEFNWLLFLPCITHRPVM
jgi:ELWxxDGT repeat protein